MDIIKLQNELWERYGEAIGSLPIKYIIARVKDKEVLEVRLDLDKDAYLACGKILNLPSDGSYKVIVVKK